MNAKERKLLLAMIEHYKEFRKVPGITKLSQMCEIREYTAYESFRQMEKLGFVTITNTVIGSKGNSVVVKLTPKADEAFPRLRELA